MTLNHIYFFTTKHFFYRLLYILSSSLPVVSVLFFSATKGLVYGYDENHGVPLYTNDLMSSGSDDHIAITMGGLLFVVPLVISIFRIFKCLAKFDVILLVIIFVLSFYLILFGLEAGSLILTIKHGNTALVFYILALIWVVIYSTGQSILIRKGRKGVSRPSVRGTR